MDNKQNNHNFYDQLEGFADFSGFARDHHYRPLPDDWCVVITDVINSTRAIDNGRYKQVNAVGVASIVAVINAIKPTVIPYVFGGDGASACFPSALTEQVIPALVSTRQMAEQQFSLQLRIGIVPIKDIRSAGWDVLVAKYQPHEYFQQAMFSGGGLSHAEKLVKDPSADNPYLITHTATGLSNVFEGFECRWNEIPSPHEETISLLVQATDQDVGVHRALYQQVMDAILSIYGRDDAHHPLRQDGMSLTFSPRLLGIETRIRNRLGGGLTRLKYLARLLILQWVGKRFMATGKTTSKTRWGDYKTNLIQNTDYRKFDEALRMVISGKPEQREALQTSLEQLYRKGKLVYGIHAAPAALITCIVNDYNHDHVHFLDGAAGGYAMAAKELKAQLRALKTRKD